MAYDQQVVPQPIVMPQQPAVNPNYGPPSQLVMGPSPHFPPPQVIQPQQFVQIQPYQMSVPSFSIQPRMIDPHVNGYSNQGEDNQQEFMNYYHAGVVPQVELAHSSNGQGDGSKRQAPVLYQDTPNHVGQ